MLTAHKDLEYTGERMVPGLADSETYWEHVARYRFATAFVGNRDVVDIACGEGYGTAALQAAGARSVIGIDVAPDAVAHAKVRYGIDARCGSADAIPLPDESIDVIVSFETIEHVVDPPRFLSECARILKDGGTLVISTPNVTRYRHRTPNNPYHHSEMDVVAFEALLNRQFRVIRLLGQKGPVPWYMRRRGVRRFSYRARRALCPRASPPSCDVEHTVRICAQPPRRVERWLWPDMVCTYSRVALDRCMYAVAVATKRVD